MVRTELYFVGICLNAHTYLDSFAIVSVSTLSPTGTRSVWSRLPILYQGTETLGECAAQGYCCVERAVYCSKTTHIIGKGDMLRSSGKYMPAIGANELVARISNIDRYPSIRALQYYRCFTSFNWHPVGTPWRFTKVFPLK